MLHFMRHGESTYNLLGLCNDRIDPAVCLTPRGREQAQRAAGRLARAGIARIITSPLPRARETAAIVNARLGAPIEVHPLLHDWRTGLDGHPVAELYAAIANDPWDTRLPGGESLREHHDRITRFITWLHDEPPTITLIVAHEETLRVAAAHFRGLDRHDCLALKFANCEIVSFERRCQDTHYEQDKTDVAR